MIDRAGHIEYSVALCTHNNAARLKTTLFGLNNLRQPKATWELLVINNACTDETEEVLNCNDWKLGDLPIRIVFEPKLGIANARNRAISESKGEYVIFLDDDETPENNWLVEYELAIREWHPDALGGRIEILFEGADRPRWLQNDLLGFLGQLSHGTEPKWLRENNTSIFTGNAGFSKTTFETIGYFDTSLGRKGTQNSGGEDVDMYRRMVDANMKIRWVPDAVIYHRIQASKLRKSYFHELHFRQGLVEGRRNRGERSRVPPLYLIPQFGRALAAALRQRFRSGKNRSLRKEMNVSYFAGYILGWIKD